MLPCWKSELTTVLTPVIGSERPLFGRIPFAHVVGIFWWLVFEAATTHGTLNSLDHHEPNLYIFLQRTNYYIYTT